MLNQFTTVYGDIFPAKIANFEYPENYFINTVVIISNIKTYNYEQQTLL